MISPKDLIDKLIEQFKISDQFKIDVAQSGVCFYKIDSEGKITYFKAEDILIGKDDDK